MYLDILHLACLHIHVFLQKIPRVEIRCIKRLGRTRIKMALKADFCLHGDGIFTGWSSVIEDDHWQLNFHIFNFFFLPQNLVETQQVK